MMDLVGTGGDGDPVRKAARNVVAAYLNASTGIAFAFTTGEIVAMWDAAVADGGAQAFLDVHQTLGSANQRDCPFP